MSLFATHSIAQKRPAVRCAITTRRHRCKGTTFTHDGRNRLIKAQVGTTTTMHYGYNPDGLRIESVKNPSSISAAGMPVGGTRTRYVLSGSEEVADLDANKNALRRFVPGPAIDERVAQIEANGAITFMHTDRQSSVVAISDSTGNVSASNRRAYGTYGETNPAQMTGTGSHPFGYTGRRWDPDLNLYYYRARWYDPTLGTFLETDPIGSLDYVNLYSYVGAEPGNGTDPSGMETEVAGNRLNIIPEDRSVPRVNIPNNVGAKGINKEKNGSFHSYDVKTKTGMVGAAAASALGSGLKRDPTPGKDDAASPTGTVNDVGPIPTTDGTNFVRSYSIPTPDAAKFTDIIVNHTIAGRHGLTEGFVMRYGEIGTNGEITLRSYGEGSAWQQDPRLEGIWGPQGQEVWNKNQLDVIRDARP